MRTNVFVSCASATLVANNLLAGEMALIEFDFPYGWCSCGRLASSAPGPVPTCCENCRDPKLTGHGPSCNLRQKYNPYPAELDGTDVLNNGLAGRPTKARARSDPLNSLAAAPLARTAKHRVEQAVEVDIQTAVAARS